MLRDRHCMGRHGPDVRYSDTWQLVINTGRSVVTFLMVFLIQSTQNRDGAAKAKLERGARGYPCVNANFDSDLS
jgi:low affinity Fe/Cu permease